MARLSDSGIVVRFPRSMSPDSITREMPVMDLFSGYEWRVALINRDQALVTALVVAPNDSLRLHRYATIKDAYDSQAGRTLLQHARTILAQAERGIAGIGGLEPCIEFPGDLRKGHPLGKIFPQRRRMLGRPVCHFHRSCLLFPPSPTPH